jgi:hypothetical protein
LIAESELDGALQNTDNFIFVAVHMEVVSACGPIDHSHGNSSNTKVKDNSNDKVKNNENENETDNENVVGAKNPYVTISVANDVLKDGHAKYQGDIIPAPKDGCPTTVVATGTPYPSTQRRQHSWRLNY